MYVHTTQPQRFPKCLLALRGVLYITVPPPRAAGNVFTGTDELEVYDAQNTLWRNNDVPSSACLDIVETDDGLPIPISTFANDSDELPSEC